MGDLQEYIFSTAKQHQQQPDYDPSVADEIRDLHMQVLEMKFQKNELLGKLEKIKAKLSKPTETENETEEVEETEPDDPEVVQEFDFRPVQLPSLQLQEETRTAMIVNKLSAKRPKVISSSEFLQFATHRESGIIEKTIHFKFGPWQRTRELQLTFMADFCDTDWPHSMRATISVDGDLENEISAHQRDYFVEMCFMKNNPSTCVQKWFQITAVGERGMSNFREEKWGLNNCKPGEFGRLSFSGKFSGLDEYATVRGSKYTVKMLVTLSVMQYDAIVDTFEGPQPASPEKRVAKLMDCSGQLESVITLKVGDFRNITIPERILRDSGSFIFKSIFELSPKSKEKPQEISIPYISSEAVYEFRNWVYGMHTDGLLQDIHLNLELLQFAYEYMICDLIQFCTTNVVNFLTEKFNLDLLAQVWKHKFPGFDDADLIEICIDKIIKKLDEDFTVEYLESVCKLQEKHKVPGLEQRVHDWIKHNSETNFDVFVQLRN